MFDVEKERQAIASRLLVYRLLKIAWEMWTMPTLKEIQEIETPTFDVNKWKMTTVMKRLYLKAVPEVLAKAGAILRRNSRQPRSKTLMTATTSFTPARTKRCVRELSRTRLRSPCPFLRGVKDFCGTSSTRVPPRRHLVCGCWRSF